jgi:hypothetical protein
MVTYLVALRFAVNVEQMLQELQKDRFALIGDSGARAMPPLIPLCRYHQAPEAAHLDHVRKTHTVTLPRSEAVPMKVPPARILLGNTEHRQETARHIQALQRALMPPNSEPQFSPEIVLSWQEETAAHSPAALPQTSAFWLSVFEYESGDKPWWEYLTWRETYARRLRTPSH